jgi:hypothetical protein
MLWQKNKKKKNWFLRHKFLTVIIAIVVIMVIGGSKGGNSSTSPASSSGSKQEQKATSFKMNEVAQNGDLAFTITKVTEAKSLGNSYTKKDAQGVFKVITVKVENKGKETKTIDSSMLKLKDAQDRTFERSSDGQIAKGMAQGQVDLFLQQVQPSLSVTGEIVFDIPADATGLVLQAKDSMFGKPIDIKLE